MRETFTDCELEAYLDESLPAEEMVRLEKAVRADRALLDRLAALNARRDAGLHSLGSVWRRHRLSCPSREQLGSYLLKTVQPEVAEYIAFHVDVIGCRYCQANLADLAKQQAEAPDGDRRRRYFQSSAGYLRSRAK